MDEKEKTAQPVPYVAFEAEMTRRERTERRLWVVIIILIIALVGSNAGWIYYNSQFEDIAVTQDIETGEGNAFVAGVGDVNYGESETNGKNP